jgi:hypothetical protein
MKTYECLNCSASCTISHQKINKYCSVQCQKDFEYKSYISEWKQELTEGIKPTLSKHVKRYLFEKFNNSCCKCGLSSWQGSAIVLEVEHKDGNSYNNKEENLELLCPNCHSQTETYKNKNMGNGRHNRRQRYADGLSY